MYNRSAYPCKQKASVIIVKKDIRVTKEHVEDLKIFS